VFAPAIFSTEKRANPSVSLAGGLSPEELTVVSSALALEPDEFLLDSQSLATYEKALLAACQPNRIVPVGSFRGGIAELGERLGCTLAPSLPLEEGRPLQLWKARLPADGPVVICSPEARSALLQAGWLAGLLHAPLFLIHDRTDEAACQGYLAERKTREVYVVGEAVQGWRDAPGVLVRRLKSEKIVADLCLTLQAKKGPICTVVVTNPEDLYDGRGGLSALAPFVALRQGAALLLTNADGDDTEEIVRAATRRKELRGVESVLLLATPRAIPMQVRPNPVAGDKDTNIEMEPLTPHGAEPFSYAVGRLFHDDPAAVLMMLARQRRLAEAHGPRRALLASNPGGSLPLLEMFSRNTALELRNAGYETTAKFGDDIEKDDLRRRLPESDVFLWEGHHSTLVKEFHLPDWDEPLPGTFVFLQSCLALTEEKALPLLSRGAVGVVGSSSRTYSASGGACSLAFFDAVLYDNQSVGSGLRQAKNFLLAYAQLKEKRLGKDAKRTGANLRAAWAFTLWGDPTLTLPHPERPANALSTVKTSVDGNTIVVSLPESRYDAVTSKKFQVRMLPNERLAGLIHKDEDSDDRPLVPFVFAEVALPKAKAGMVPELSSKLPSSRYVFTWDERRECGYLLALPRDTDTSELRFHVSWKAIP
jgi:hypothetical protein